MWFIIGLVGGVFVGYLWRGKSVPKSQLGSEKSAQPQQLYQEPEPEQNTEWEAKIKARSAAKRAENAAKPPHLRISYEGGSYGQPRDITIRRYDGYGYIDAWCHARNNYRTFMVERIAQAIDLSTGEVIPNVEVWLNETLAWLTDEERFVYKNTDLINIITHVARADGRFTAKEKRVIESALAEMGVCGALDPKELIATAAKEWGFPSKVEYGKSMRAYCANHPEHAEKLWCAMIDMAVVDKRLNRDEELAVLNMGKQLGYNQKAVEEKIAERMPSK